MTEDLIKIISKNKGLATFLDSFLVHCPNFPYEFAHTDIDIMKANFCRYTKRTMYYAENFVKNLIVIENEIKNNPYLNADDLMTTISDDIYFDFDAFVFSCKSIVEGKIMERSKGFHSSIKKDFDKYAKSTFDRFIKTYLTPIRDEVVHLNNYGSSSGSMLHRVNNKIFIKAFDYSDNMELQKVFTTILTEMTLIINNVTVFIMRHECENWGYPKKDITFHANGNQYNISEYITIPSS